MSAVSILRRVARGRSEATPAWLLIGVGLVVAAAVLVVTLLLYGIQAAS
jgi:fumarate reductase subunit D